MDYPNPKYSLAQLRTFVAISEELCFRRAAQRLHMAPSSLSAQMRSLEEAIGSPLLVRSRRAVSLTRSGTLLVDEAQALLAQAERVVRLAGMAGNRKRSGRIVIGVSRELTETVHRVAQQFLHANSSTELAYREIVSSEQCKALREHKIDVSFLRTPTRPVQVNSALLYSQPLVAILPANHPLAHRKKVTASELAGETLLVRARASARAEHDQVLDLFRRAGLRPEVSETTLSPQFVADMRVASGQGIYIVPENIVETGKATAAVRLDEPLATRDVYVAWRAGKTAANLKDFVDAARRIFSDAGADGA